MDYTLAKQLKEAGWKHQCGLACPPDTEFDKHPVNRPTLEELIEACGARFVGLRRKVGKRNWEASYLPLFTDEVPMPAHIRAKGPTPTEAVARLWLALQGK